MKRRCGPRIPAAAFLFLTSCYAGSVTPATATLSAGQTQQFTAVCPATNPTCSVHDWAVDSTYCAGPKSGTVSPAGLYTAPPSVAASATVYLSVSLGDAFTACAAVIHLSASAPVPPLPVPLVSALSFGQGLYIGPNPSQPSYVLVSVDPTQVVFLTLNANAGLTCTGFSVSFSGTDLLACIGGTWRRFTPVSP